MNELICLRASEPVGSDRYNKLSDAIQWVNKQELDDKSKIEQVKRNYAHTRIRWKDCSCNSGEEYDVVFKLNSKRNFLGNFELDPKDDEIFFYCESEEEFNRIASGYDNGEDFEVIGCILYTESI